MDGPLHVWVNRSASGCFQEDLELEKLQLSSSVESISSCPVRLHIVQMQRGSGPRGSSSHVCCPCCTHADLSGFTWELEVTLFQVNFHPYCHWTLRTAHGSRGRRHYPTSASQKTRFRFLSFTHLENLDQVSVPGACLVLWCFPGKEEMWPTVALCANSLCNVLFTAEIVQF